MAKPTPLQAWHQAQGGRLVDFAGWSLPIHYGSQINEHHAVRQHAGLFDVSHMGIVDLRGSGSRDLLRWLLANDVARLDENPGRALYSCLLNPAGGVLDDLIVYYMSPEWYRVVVNGATRDSDLAWLTQHAAGRGVTVTLRDDLAMVALQGPAAPAIGAPLLSERYAIDVAALSRFQAAAQGDYFVGRTGYTGEDGYEVMLPAAEVTPLAEALTAAGVAPCGLGARDTLRLEAGMNLYGQDMDSGVTPLESGLAWTVSLTAERDFIGRDALLKQRTLGIARTLVGVVLRDAGVLRPQQPVRCASGGVGVITSGSFSPTLQRSIGFARVPAGDADGCRVEVRGRELAAQIVRLPFVRNGVATFQL